MAEGPKIAMPEIRAGSYGAFAFGEVVSYKTIHTRNHDEKSTCETFLADEHSMFTMEKNDTDVMGPDEMETNMRAKEQRVEVDFGYFMNLGDTSAEKIMQADIVVMLVVSYHVP